jgi:hypothetical protein
VRAFVLLVGLAVSVAACDLLPWPPQQALTEGQAIAIARAAVPDRFRDEVLRVDRLPYREVASEFAPVLSKDPPTPDQCVFHINIGSDPGPLMGQGVFVILDCFTGEVIHITNWIS